jgi:hypothetical protein
MFGALLGLVDPISRIVGKIADAKLEANKALTDRERIAADERVKALEAKRDVLVAESASPWNARMRLFIAFGPALYLNKIFIWDKVLGPITGGRTDALDENLWKVIAAVIGFYFLYEASRFLARR